MFLVLAAGLGSVVSAIVRLSNIMLWNDAEDSTYIGSVIPVLPTFFSSSISQSLIGSFIEIGVITTS